MASNRTPKTQRFLFWGVPLFLSLLCLCATATLSGCLESSSSGGGNGPKQTSPSLEQISTHTVTLSADGESSYYHLGRGAEVTADEGTSEAAWHLRFELSDDIDAPKLRLNGGEHGPGYVVGFLAKDAPDGFYDENTAPQRARFEQSDPESMKRRMLGRFETPEARLRPAISGEVPLDEPGSYFFKLDMSSTPPKLTENPANGWLIRGRDGETYARLRATNINFDMGGPEDVGFQYTFELDLQPQGAGGFESHANAADLEFSGELERYRLDEQCFDFVSFDAQDADPGVADCSGDAWDLMIFRDPTAQMGEDLSLLLNGGVDREGRPRSGAAAAIGPVPWSELSELQSASDLDGFPEDFVSDQLGGIEYHPWYEQFDDGRGGSILLPNYRVYLIDTDIRDSDAPRFALQIVAYKKQADGKVEINFHTLQIQ